MAEVDQAVRDFAEAVEGWEFSRAEEIVRIAVKLANVPDQVRVRPDEV